VGPVDRSSAPDEPGPPEQPNERGRDLPRQVHRDLPDPDERSRVYEATRAAAERQEEELRAPDRSSRFNGTNGRPDPADGDGAAGDRQGRDGVGDRQGRDGAGDRQGRDGAGDQQGRDGASDREPDQHNDSAGWRGDLPKTPREAYFEALKAAAEAMDTGPADPDVAPRGSPDHRVGRRPDQADRGPEAQAPSYWDKVPSFFAAWAEHVRRWPERGQRAATVDRSQDPPGAFRSDGNAYLSPEQNARTTELIGRVRSAEPPVSDGMRTTERASSGRAWLEGFKYRLKGEDRLKEKVAEVLRDNADTVPENVVPAIPDAIRYTFCTQPKNYADGYNVVREKLESLGYEMHQSKNSWSDPEYKGINTRWVTQEGQRFEVQFHTPESFHAKQSVTHGAYERLRNPLTSDAERRELHAFQREVSSWIRVPNGAGDILDLKKEGF
jgi:hypothetical protein